MSKKDNHKKATNTGKDKDKGTLKPYWWECTSSTGHFGKQYPGFTKLKAELLWFVSHLGIYLKAPKSTLLRDGYTSVPVN